MTTPASRTAANQRLLFESKWHAMERATVSKSWHGKTLESIGKDAAWELFKFAQAALPPREPPAAESALKTGDYVFATKYSDGDPDDQWCVGFYDCERDGRHYVKNAAGEQYRANGFRRCARISTDVGKRILEEAPGLEKSPPGINLWNMFVAGCLNYANEWWDERELVRNPSHWQPLPSLPFAKEL